MSANVLSFPAAWKAQPLTLEPAYPEPEPERPAVHRARLDLPNSLCRPGSLQLLRDVVASLPPWRPDQHEDPTWIVGPQAFGLAANTYPLRPLQTEWRAHRARPVLTDLVGWVQPTIRLDALLHYAEHPQGQTHLFDPDGWFGNDLPIITEHPDGGLVVLDGTHRVCAAIVRGDDLIECYRVASSVLAA